jgi:hypothetical protein
MAGYAVLIDERARIGGLQASGGKPEGNPQNDDNNPFCAHEEIYKSVCHGAAKYKESQICQGKADLSIFLRQMRHWYINFIDEGRSRHINLRQRRFLRH